MDDFYSTPEIERYLKSILGSSVRIVKQSILAKPGRKSSRDTAMERPCSSSTKPAAGRPRRLAHGAPGPFGHEHMSDRAQSLLWDHSAFNTLPRHVRSIDVGAFRTNRTTVSLGDVEEFFTLTDYGQGAPYAADLERIRDSGDFRLSDAGTRGHLCATTWQKFMRCRVTIPACMCGESGNWSAIRNASWD
jgi:hypothetical protein